MISRRAALAAAALCLALAAPAFAAAPIPFTSDAFKAAEAAGKPILVHITATWCVTCKAQQAIVRDLTADPAFAALTIFAVDFDARKDVMAAFKARERSTMIVFKGASEVGRATGDTDAASIKALLSKAL